MQRRLSQSLLLVVPAVWIGMLIAIDAIEAPLKFLAPGITIPLGLGIGRLVFTAMNALEAVLFVVLLIAMLRTSMRGLSRTLGLAIGAIVLVKVAVLRPLLSARTDAVLAGVDDGGSAVHLLYIGADVLLGALLLWFLIREVRRLLPAPAAALGEDVGRGR